MAKAQPIEHSNALRKESSVREEKTRQPSQQKWQEFSRQYTFFANFIKPEKSDKSCHYEKQESIRDGLTKRLIAEEANRKNVNDFKKLYNSFKSISCGN